jgi:heme/copper-type cytochrome/quinol oxidase subunit 3
VSTVQAERGRVEAPTEPGGLIAGPHGLHRGKAPGWWAMVFLIATEAMFFTILLTSYWYIRFRSGPAWPPPPLEKPKLLLVGIMTPILLLSSAPMHWAELGIKRGRTWQLKLGLMATLAMGLTFLALQYVEYREILTREFTPRTNAYGTLFFSITGFHGFHVLVGLVLNLWLQFYAWRRAFSAERYLPVENVVMYWHFVDAVWVFIFSSLYLAPHVWP